MGREALCWACGDRGSRWDFGSEKGGFKPCSECQGRTPFARIKKAQDRRLEEEAQPVVEELRKRA